jgi:hypothetical protein
MRLYILCIRFHLVLLSLYVFCLGPHASVIRYLASAIRSPAAALDAFFDGPRGTRSASCSYEVAVYAAADILNPSCGGGGTEGREAGGCCGVRGFGMPEVALGCWAEEGFGKGMDDLER